MVVINDFCKLWEVPREPLFKSHAKSINIFVQLLDESNGLNNWFILPIYICGALLPGVGMAKTELCPLHIIIINLFHNFDEMGLDASHELCDGIVVGGGDACFRENSKKLVNEGLSRFVTYSYPIFGSTMPRRNFCFFELLVAGRWVVRKFLSVFVTLL